MPPDKDDKDDAVNTDNTDSYKTNKLPLNDTNTDKTCIKYNKTNKVSDINRESPKRDMQPATVYVINENHIGKEQKPKKKIQFSSDVRVKDTQINRCCTFDKLSDIDKQETNETGYTIEDFDEETTKVVNEETSIVSPTIKKAKSVQLPRERVIDMSPEDQKQWELEEMLKPIDLEKTPIHIDPSPFQLVERTSILKVHSLFSMVGINHAYVTKIGRLVGVVGLKELRKAIEDINSNSFVAHTQVDEIENDGDNDGDADGDGDIKPAVKKPLLLHCPSDKAVDMTITSMDSALSNSDNCSDIEMEHIKSLDTPEVTLTMPSLDTNSTTTITTQATNNTQNLNKSV